MGSVKILDGAAGTYLESLGVDLHPTLWSSGALLTPEGKSSLEKMHCAYIDAGADIITSTTYQASIPGFMAEGLTESESKNLITEGVHIARCAAEKRNTAERKVSVAGGLGPYGAYLSHGEEYSGQYGSVTYEELLQFWRPRVESVLAAGPDYLLFETIPNKQELEIILNELVPMAQNAGIPVWISLSLKIPENLSHNGISLADGTTMAGLSQYFDGKNENIIVGANCFDVVRVPDVLRALQRLGVPLLVYPNSGEVYDGNSKTWANASHGPADESWDPKAWADLGSVVIGGCCRTSPQTITQIKKQL